MGVPERFSAPDTVAVYAVPGASAGVPTNVLVGTNVAVLVEAL